MKPDGQIQCWSGDRAEQSGLADPDGYGLRRRGDYDEQWAKDLRAQFEALLRTKRLNELDRSRSTSSSSTGFDTTPSYASLRNSPNIASPPANSSSLKFRNLLISLTLTPTKYEEHSPSEIFWAKSKAHPDAKNRFWNAAAQLIFQHPQAAWIRPIFFQRWWQNHQHIYPGLSPHPFQSPGSMGFLRSAVDLCSALQFLHSELSHDKLTDSHHEMMNYRPANILVSPDKDCELFRTYTIYGRRGVGKTDIAAQFAYQNSCDFDAIFWIQCETSVAKYDWLKETGKVISGPAV
jgi:hypothetical protein